MGFHYIQFLQEIPPKFQFLPIRDIFPDHLILIDLLIIGEECRSRSLPLCGFLHLAFNSSFLGSHFLLSLLPWKKVRSCYWINWSVSFFTIVKNNGQNCGYLCFSDCALKERERKKQNTKVYAPNKSVHSPSLIYS